jgi:hypothetical protein
MARVGASEERLERVRAATKRTRGDSSRAAVATAVAMPAWEVR